MRSIVLFSLAVLLTAGLAGQACSSSSAASGAKGDAGGVASDDGGTAADGSGDALDDAPSSTCGPAPWVTLGITVDAYGADGGTALEGARFTSPLCPGEFELSAADGTLTGHVSKGVAFYGRFDATNYVSTLTPEQEYQADDSSVILELLPGALTLIIPGYDATKATIFVGALQDTGTGACNTLDGISFSIVGQPEATPTYYSTDAIPQPVTGTVTTASGRASFAGLAVGDPVTMMGTKPGCVVTFVYGPNTGRAPREAGYVTFIGAHVDDLDDAGAGDAAGE